MRAGHVGLALTVTHLLTGNVELTILSSILTTLPDVLKNYSDDGRWNGTYELFHKPWNRLSGKQLRDFIIIFWILLFPIGLHCGYDYFTHKKNTPHNIFKGIAGKWNSFAYISEGFWATIGIIYLFFIIIPSLF